jgi:hypothetical protein
MAGADPRRSGDGHQPGTRPLMTAAGPTPQIIVRELIDEILREFAADVAKLAKLQQGRRDLACFGLVIDQSISLPIGRSRTDLVSNWLDLVRDLRRYDVEPAPPFVEVWFADPDSSVHLSASSWRSVWKPSAIASTRLRARCGVASLRFVHG